MSLRAELVAEVKKYLVGPREPDELLPGPPAHPADYYTSGILFPRNAKPDSLDTDDLEAGGSDGETVEDVGAPSPPQTKQNSMGLRVDIRDGADSVDLDVDYAKYRRTENGWKRIPLAHAWRHHSIRLGERKGLIKIRGDDGSEEADLRWVLDEGRDGHERHRVLSCFLSNAASWIEYDGGGGFESVRTENSHRTIFQPSIRIYSTRPVFRNYRPHARGGLRTAEDQSLDLLFADTVSFGRGSNCAAVWEQRDEPLWVRTEFVPTYTAPDVGKESGGDGRPGIEMRRLSYAEDDNDELYRRQFAEAIRPLIDSYGRWIDAEEQKIPALSRNTGFRAEIARSHIRRCRDACARMSEGLEFLLAEDNKKTRLAFALANRAMLYQRLYYDYSLRVAKGEAPARRPNPAASDAAWYPFQMAFLVMNVRGIADESSGERDTVDLLWFPTGGGKTEAYLAVAAFAMIYRRTKGGDGNDGLGVSVIMRYTLRLLTLQQFERASTLMCALEFIRRDNPKYSLGDDPFLIGLWVGQNLTPNTSRQSKNAISGEERDSIHSEGSPVQHTHCPWCGTRVDARCYAVDGKSGWTVAHCSSKSCFFSSRDKTETKRALPVVTVDADIYRRCPAMIIATVDKFARMPYKEQTASLFGRVDRYCGRHGFLTAGDWCGAQSGHRDARIMRISELDGPDLIIQDELHLITGPLGSMVGLYETAVDYLSRRGLGDGAAGPKIITSTATIRGADDQVRKIFNRDPPRVFPPPGIRRADSFFWWESGRSGRQYVGTSFSHRSAKYSLARIYASLLQTVKASSGSLEPREVDPYWTLVCYFNSIRELGGAIRLVEDDVVSNIGFIADALRGGQEKRQPGRPHDGLEELTGRITQAGIRDIRKKLGRTVDDPGCISTLLATNMISVGIDIERLGMMVVNGQTKSVSEYIQATGRIGRKPGIPGLVFTLYNPYKPRDLSHYEDFTGYHSMLQRYVEPSTLTPFSVGSIERGMHAVLISMTRLSTRSLSHNEYAGRLEMDHAADAISFILDRHERVQQVGRDDKCHQYTRRYLEAFVDNWRRLVRQARSDDGAAAKICYSRPSDQGRVAGGSPAVMLADFGTPIGDTNDFPKATPNSMRNVEREVRLRYRGE